VNKQQQKFQMLRAPRRVWAVSSLHGEAKRIAALHRDLAPRLMPGDRLVYLGNMIGRGAEVLKTVDEVLHFRRRFLAEPGNFCCDIAYLRGSQEEMWQKLMQLQFASDPRGVLSWMLDQGVGATLEAYGVDPRIGLREAAAGTMQLTRWTGQLRQAMQNRPGHFQIMGVLRRAAFTEEGSLLFVHAGLDPTRPLETQKDSFWWGVGGFGRIEAPYGGYRRVVRGFAPRHPGLEEGAFTVTLDGGCGFGGPLLAVCLLPDGEIAERLEA
jgi:serine/threonine protein phosphatase 1